MKKKTTRDAIIEALEVAKSLSKDGKLPKIEVLDGEIHLWLDDPPTDWWFGSWEPCEYSTEQAKEDYENWT